MLWWPWIPTLEYNNHKLNVLKRFYTEDKTLYGVNFRFIVCINETLGFETLIKNWMEEAHTFRAQEQSKMVELWEIQSRGKRRNWLHLTTYLLFSYFGLFFFNGYLILFLLHFVLELSPSRLDLTPYGKNKTNFFSGLCSEER